jgi:Leucine-rich repeat (LRR) protein
MIGILLTVQFLAVSSISPALPDDSSAQIFSYLDSESLFRYVASSKTQRDLLRDQVKTFHVDSYSAETLSRDFSFLSEYPNLEEVYLKRAGIANVSFLRNLPRLRVLDLTGYYGADRAFDMCWLLAAAETLEVVRLWRLSPESRHCLTNFRRLKKLYVFELDDLSILQGLANLEELEIFYTWTNTLESLGALTRLKILKIDQAQAFAFTLLGLDALHGSLEELELNAVKLKTMAPIGNLSGLRRLNVGSSAVISDLVSELGKLTQLKHLQIRPCGNLAFLLNMGELRTLSIRNTKISDLRDFRNLQKLESLEIVHAHLIRDISGITFLSNLKELTLGSISTFPSQPLSLLPKLNTLRIRFCEIRTVEEIAKIVSLQSLALEFLPYLTDVSLLTPLTNLRIFHLAHTGVADVSAFLGRPSLDFSHENNAQ